MIIEIDTEKLIELDLTADEFLFLSMLSRSALDSNLKLNIDREKLQTNGWVKWGEEDECHLRSKFDDEFRKDESSIWSGLLSHYPIKVVANGSVRILRAKDPDCKANSKAKTRYLKYVGEDVTKHEHVIKCLQRELKLRRQGNGLGYMQQLETWVNNHTWEKYSDLSDGEQPKSKPPGSESRITRQL